MADAFIGSIISLVSKSDIRYEGVFSDINTHDSTIGLKNVKSFGTEGRRADGPQIPPTDNIYKYILFRGSDIKDLLVKASPPIQTVPPTFGDPAIIELHCSPSTMPCTSSHVTGSAISQTGRPNLCQPTGGPRMPMYSPPGLHGVSNDLQAQQQWMQNPTMNMHSSSTLGKLSALSSIPVKNIAHNSQSPFSINTAPNGEMVPPVTPSNSLPSGPAKGKAAPPQPLQSVHKDAEVVQVSPSEPVIPKSQPPLLPLPSPSAEKLIGESSLTRQYNGGGFGRGRRNGNSQPAARFTKEFDFEEMNEKFNKDEIWGHLSKSNQAHGSERFLQDGNDSGPSKSEAMSVYAKDEFFDSLSCNSLDHGSHKGRIKYSERKKLDAETFGDVARYGDSGGALGSGQGGCTRDGCIHGSCHTRGHGYTGRGRGHHS